MPYTVSQPPNWLKNLPAGAIRIGVSTFNRVLKETGNEDQARQAAWRNIKLKYKKVGDKWVMKSNETLDWFADKLKREREERERVQETEKLKARVKQDEFLQKWIKANNYGQE